MERSFGNTNDSRHLAQMEPPYYVKALAMALPAIMLGIQISGWVFFITPIREGHPDFRANYTAGVMVASARLRELYDYDAIKAVQDSTISQEVVGMPFIHPAFESLVYAPFSFFKFQTAYCAFLVLNLLLVFLCYRALRNELQPTAVAWKPLPIVLGFTFLPIGAALMQGQDSILMLACFVWSWSLMRRGKDFVAGLALGVSVFRFQFLAPICLLFVLGRRWRVLSGALASAAGCLLVSLTMVGVDGARTYARVIASMSIGGVTAVERVRYYQPVAAMGSMRALITDILSQWLPAPWIQGIIFFVSLAVIIWAARGGQKAETSDLLLLAITTSGIVGYHIFIHDLAILFLPLAVWLGRSIGSCCPNSPVSSKVLVATAIMFASPALMSFRFIHFYWITLAVLYFLGAQVLLHNQTMALKTR